MTEFRAMPGSDRDFSEQEMLRIHQSKLTVQCLIFAYPILFLVYVLMASGLGIFSAGADSHAEVLRSFAVGVLIVLWVGTIVAAALLAIQIHGKRMAAVLIYLSVGPVMGLGILVVLMWQASEIEKRCGLGLHR